MIRFTLLNGDTVYIRFSAIISVHQFNSNSVISCVNNQYTVKEDVQEVLEKIENYN